MKAIQEISPDTYNLLFMKGTDTQLIRISICTLKVSPLPTNQIRWGLV